MHDFTGFVAYYQDSPSVREEENYYDSSLGRVCATNWHTLNKDLVTSLEIWWKGKKKDTIRKRDHTDFQGWVFFHTGYIENGMTKTVSRTIGVKKSSGMYMFTVDEETGETKTIQQ